MLTLDIPASENDADPRAEAKRLSDLDEALVVCPIAQLLYMQLTFI
jgi:hypothetical protein